MNIALVLAGGTGIRIGSDIPKQYIEVGGKPIISYCIEVLSSHEDIDKIYIVADESWQSYISANVAMDKFGGFARPGDNRQLSILEGLRVMRDSVSENDVVLIHDAARPLITKELISRCLNDIYGHDGVMPVIALKDTVYMSDGGASVSKLLDRNTLFAGQAPEAFVYGKYYEANASLLPERILSITGSTEPAILAGLDVVMTEGDENNYKITTQKELASFCEYIDKKNKTD